MATATAMNSCSCSCTCPAFKWIVEQCASKQSHTPCISPTANDEASPQLESRVELSWVASDCPAADWRSCRWATRTCIDWSLMVGEREERRGWFVRTTQLQEFQSSQQGALHKRNGQSKKVCYSFSLSLSLSLSILSATAFAAAVMWQLAIAGCLHHLHLHY